VHLRSDFWFEYEGDIVVVGMDMSDGQQSSIYLETLTLHIQLGTQ